MVMSVLAGDTEGEKGRYTLLKPIADPKSLFLHLCAILGEGSSISQCIV